jgi:ADP-heptose:LPS heptosyltransferase
MPEYDSIIYHADCRHFRGDIPCVPNKREGVRCDGCPYYEPIVENILIIKLGAAGDVLRTTPILHRLKKEYPQARLWWLTQSPDLVPASLVDRILPWNSESLRTLDALEFSVLINLDKDKHACALASKLIAEKKLGFLLGKFGESEPATKEARDKFITGIFDDVSLANRKSYPEELFEICSWSFNGEEYIIDQPIESEFPGLDTSKPIVGMNTGAGIRWTSRLWDPESWAKLAERVSDAGFTVVLLGGPDEEERNRTIVKLANGKAHYLGCFPLKKFIALVNKCELIVTGVTMSMHIAIALRKRVVVINNIFNRYEFGDLYGLGEIVEPAKPCICYFRGQCINPDYFCLDHLSVDQMSEAVARQIGT